MNIAEPRVIGKLNEDGSVGGVQGFLGRVPRHYLYAGILLLACSGSFGLGILEGREQGRGSGITISQLGTTTPEFVTASQEKTWAAPPSTIPAGGEVVASKDGEKYYFPWCGTVKLIKEENKVWFSSREAAEAAGYEPAANCKGM